ncbi:MAG: hypothetical protein ACK5O2_06750 [Microthrixaceae bacterium]
MAGSNRKRRSDRRFSTAVVLVAVIVVVAIAGGVTAKVLADRAATDQVDDRTSQIQRVLEGSGPKDFLAFNSGRSVPDSVAKEVSDAADFVSVDAGAQRAVIRFQPKGWWAGFTERCIVAVVTDDGTAIDTPKTACVRTDPSDY